MGGPFGPIYGALENPTPPARFPTALPSYICPTECSEVGEQTAFLNAPSDAERYEKKKIMTAHLLRGRHDHRYVRYFVSIIAISFTQHFSDTFS